MTTAMRVVTMGNFIYLFLGSIDIYIFLYSLFRWSMVDVPIPETYMNITHMTRTLSGLKPYTQYAFYIKTYTIDTEKRGGQSQLQYFRTDADRKSFVYKLKFLFNIIINITHLKSCIKTFATHCIFRIEPAKINHFNKQVNMFMSGFLVACF